MQGSPRSLLTEKPELTADPDLAATSGARRWVIAGLPWITTLALLGIWELLSRTGVLPSEVPPVTTIVQALLQILPTAQFGNSLVATVGQFGLALVFGVAVGLVLGVALGAIPLLYKLSHYLLDFLRFIPAVVYLPLLVLVMGATPKVGYLLGAVGAVWPMIFQAYYGVAGVSPTLQDSARVFGLKVHQRLLHVTLPAVSPFVATGLRIAAAHVLVVVVAVEIISAIPGMGDDIQTYASNAVYPKMYALVLMVGVLGLLVNSILQWFERRLLHWHVAYREVER